MGNTIHKHPIGYLLITLTGALLLAGLILGMFAIFHAGALTPALYGLLSTLIVAVVLGTTLSLWFYYWSVLIIGTSNVAVTNWISLFASVQAEAEWIDIVDVTVRTPSILGQIVGYATIEIKTASDTPNLIFTRLANAQTVADGILRTMNTLKTERNAANV